MHSAINIVAILIANGFGAGLILILISSSLWRLRSRTKESSLLNLILAAIFLCCISDPLIFFMDGRPGFIPHMIVSVGSYWLFAANMIVGHCWLAFVCYHLIGYFPSTQKYIARAITTIGSVLLIVNLFHPIIFTVDSSNVYSRLALFPAYAVFFICYILDSIFVYIRVRIKGGSLKFFPIWAFLIPFLLGLIAQICVYGISTIWPCTALAAAGVIISLQNESIFRDPLTGLYSRFYLDDLKERPRNRTLSGLTILMLDLNDFKSINDEFGHQVGDEALKETAALLRTAVGSVGTIIRYAGDEFFILLNTQEEVLVKEHIDCIHKTFREFNRAAGKPYSLSASIGFCPLDLKSHTINEAINEVDRRMYASKKAYYDSQKN